jgi:hypothetical protein
MPTRARASLTLGSTLAFTTWLQPARAQA